MKSDIGAQALRETNNNNSIKPLFCDFLCKELAEKKKVSNFAGRNISTCRIMSIEERKAIMAENRAVNSKKPARSAFMKWARAHKGAFIINDPELKARITTYLD